MVRCGRSVEPHDITCHHRHPSSQWYNQGGRTYDAVDIAIAFVDKVARDADGEDNAAVYNRMKSVGVEFIKALNASGYFLPIDGTINYQVLCEQLSDIVTGVMFTIRLQEQGRC